MKAFVAALTVLSLLLSLCVLCSVTGDRICTQLWQAQLLLPDAPDHTATALLDSIQKIWGQNRWLLRLTVHQAVTDQYEMSLFRLCAACQSNDVAAYLTEKAQAAEALNALQNAVSLSWDAVF